MTDMNKEREAFEAWARDDFYSGFADIAGDRLDTSYRDMAHHMAWYAYQAGRASLAASAGSPEINGQLYTALNNLFTHLGMEGCITADHAFVWDAMTALKRIDGGVHLDNLAVPVDPDAHRDDMLAAVQLLEDGEWAEHFAKTPIGMRLEEQITKLHGEISAAPSSEPIPDCPVCGDNAKVSSISGMWHCENCHGNRAASAGSEPVATVDHNMPGSIRWHFGPPSDYDGKLYTHPSPTEGMAGWKPIATAPKDGTLILVHFKSKGVRAVSWDSPFHDEVTEENGIWCVDDDKHGPYGLRGYNDDGPTAPTHWMPLPAPPASEAKGA